MADSRGRQTQIPRSVGSDGPVVPLDLRLGRGNVFGVQSIEPEVTSPPTRPRPATRWIRGPLWDIAMSLAWVPFSALALVWAGDVDRIEWLVGATLLFSVSHQSFTVPLV